MIQEPIQAEEQIEDVQDEDDGKPVSSDYLGTITTIEEIMDVIGNVLNYVEIVGRELSKNEIMAFRWIEKAYCMPTFKKQAERLQGRQAEKFLDAATEFEALLYPSDAENPQQITPLRLRKKNQSQSDVGGMFLFDECMN